MNRAMRNKDWSMSETETMELLQKSSYGVLATVGYGGAPYGVPMNFACAEGAVYLQCGKEGQLMDHLVYHDQVCFTVVGDESGTSGEKKCYESAMIFGTAEEVADSEELHSGEEAMKLKYGGLLNANENDGVGGSRQSTKLFKIAVRTVSGQRNPTVC